MAFDFGAFLTSVGSLAPAQQAAQEDIVRKRREQQAFATNQRLRNAQITGIEQRNKEWIPLREYTTANGSKRTTYLTPTGYQDVETEPSPEVAKQREVEATIRMLNNPYFSSLTPEQKAGLAASGGKTLPKSDELTQWQKAQQQRYEREDKQREEDRKEALQFREKEEQDREKDRRETEALRREQMSETRADRAERLRMERERLSDTEEDRKLKREGMVTVNGRPVKPTSKMLSNDQLAHNLLDNLGTIDKYITNHPDQLNQGAWARNWISMKAGHGDGDFVDMRSAANLTALPGIGIHGARGIQLAKTWEKMIYDGITSGPDGAKRAIDRVTKSAQDFLLDPASGGLSDDGRDAFTNDVDEQIIKALNGAKK